MNKLTLLMISLVLAVILAAPSMAAYATPDYQNRIGAYWSTGGVPTGNYLSPPVQLLGGHNQYNLVGIRMPTYQQAAIGYLPEFYTPTPCRVTGFGYTYAGSGCTNKWSGSWSGGTGGACYGDTCSGYFRAY